MPFDAGKRLRDVAFADGGFGTVGNDGLVVISADGTSWDTYHLLRLEASANLQTWDAIAAKLSSPMTIPATGSRYRFFRLVPP